MTKVMWMGMRAAIALGFVIAVAGIIVSSINLYAGSPKIENINCTVHDCDENNCLFSTIFYYNKGSPCGIVNFICYLNTYSPSCSEVNGTSGFECYDVNDWNHTLRDCYNKIYRFNGLAVLFLTISSVMFIVNLCVLGGYVITVKRSYDDLTTSPLLIKQHDEGKL